jgi:hypothetical protein
MSTPEAQQFVYYNVCLALETAVETVEGKPIPLIRQEGGYGSAEVACFMRGFKDWVDGNIVTPGNCTDGNYTTEADCTDNSFVWTPAISLK